jgi:transposase InsO family protein
MSGPEFEEALGTFLAWSRTHQLNRRFTRFGAPEFVGVPGPVTQWHDFNEQRTLQVLAALHETLYESFGSAAISVEAAKSAYRQLIDAMGGKANRYIVATTNYIEKGQPQQNCFVERFNGSMRNEVLANEDFDTVLEARIIVQQWALEEYNTRRPHRGHGMLTPRQFAERWKVGRR